MTEQPERLTIDELRKMEGLDRQVHKSLVFEKEKETKVDTSPAGKAKIRKLIEGIGK